METAEHRDRRRIAIERVEHECEACGWLAWSRTREAELQLRERETEPDRPRVLCPRCAGKYDARKRRKALI
jgi:Zn finger protein HypA/HybF involved in hydrogenase expression